MANGRWIMESMSFLLIILLILSIILEGTITTLPLVFVCLVCLTILMRSQMLFVLAFLSGFFLDAFTLQRIGSSSIFLLVAVLLILLYQRKYEINTYPFVLLASFAGAFFYLLIFGYGSVIWLAVLSSVIAVLLLAVSRLSLKFKTQN
jgi:hypothetical protein